MSEPLEKIAERFATVASRQSPGIGRLGQGPVLSVVRNTLTGQIYVGLNTGWPPSLTDVVGRAIVAQARRIAAREVILVHTAADAVGGHAEVNAVNRAIRDREKVLGHKMVEKELRVFELHNVWLGRKGGPAPRCEHCARITRGVTVTNSLFWFEGGVSGEINTRSGSVNLAGGRVKGPPPKVVSNLNKTLHVTPDGKVYKNPPPTNPRAQVSRSGSRSDRPIISAVPGGNVSGNGAPPPAPKVGPATTIQNGVNSFNGRTQAVGGGVNLFFRGANFVVHQINDGIQERKLKTNWTQLEPSISNRLADDPTLGALIIGQYSIGQKGGNENSSPMQPTASFQRLESSFGFDREDAWERYHVKSSIRPTGHGVPDSLPLHWHPPSQPVDITKLPTPFPAAGLATFVPGREELVKVFFSHLPGFDERWRSVEKVKTAYDVLSFFYLLPPDKVHYLYNGEQTEVIPVLVEPPGEVAHSELKHIHVPVVQLDSKVNPYNATAAMIYPADNFTARVFADTTPMGGRDLLQYRYKVEKLRWVKPHKMRVLRVFSEEQLNKSLADHDRKAEYDRIRLRSSNGSHVTCGPQHAHRGSWCF